MAVALGLLALGVSLLSAAVLLGLFLWKWGAGLARGLGVFLILSNLSRLALVVFVPWVLKPALTWLAIGVGLWLVGHWVHIVRHGYARSPLALRVFALPGLRALVPSPVQV